MQVIRITNSVFATNGGGIAEEVLKAGQELPADDAEGLRQIGRNNAELVEAAPVEVAAEPQPEPEAAAAEAVEEPASEATEGKRRGKKAAE